MPNYFLSFPNATTEHFELSSPESVRYNCIAWAADDIKKPWWPDADGYWPIQRREETLEAFMEAFSTLGYRACDNGDKEEGWDKIAIYTKNGIPTHAAWQKPEGIWSSKMGAWHDLDHSIPALDGGEYGEVAQFMKRRARPRINS